MLLIRLLTATVTTLRDHGFTSRAISGLRYAHFVYLQPLARLVSATVYRFRVVSHQ